MHEYNVDGDEIIFVEIIVEDYCLNPTFDLMSTREKNEIDHMGKDKENLLEFQNKNV